MNLLDGEQIRRVREQLGWKQRQLATRADVDPSIISRLERNLQGDTTLSVVVAIARALNVRIDDLLTGREENGQRGSLHPDWQAVVAEVNSLPMQQQGQAAAILRGYLSSL